MPRFLRIALAIMPVLLGLPAGAAELSCPTRVLLGGLETRTPGTAAGLARVDPQNRLLCIYQGLGFTASSARPPEGYCQPRPLALQVSGGSGTWRFGTPGSQPSILPPVQAVGGGCLFGGQSYVLPQVVAWREPPSGEACTPHPTSSSRFLCGPITAGVAAAPSAPAEGAAACPPRLIADTMPGEPWEEGRAVGYYAPESFLLDADSGRLVKANVSLGEIRQAMGPAWRRAIFLLSSTPAAQSRLPAGTYSCSYEGPRFTQRGRAVEATIAIACTGECRLTP